MSDELKAAANRFADYDLADFQGPTGDCADIRAGIALSRYVLADLAARKAEARERALPIDEEWLEDQRYRRDGGGDWSNRHIVLKKLRDCSWGVFIAGGVNTTIYIGNHFTTRGDLLNLMIGLKIPTKGGAE